ncbi:hypothetical protein AB0L75_11055 [Streptomyces sp. NPDC052101]|uniref:hypothetical protein n=1 Tax=Streptomyces sp. NPDC052101 TaxID=3155763 RepID=UPI00341B637A
MRRLPQDPPLDRQGSGPRRIADRIDLPGILGFAQAMSALVVFLMRPPHPERAALAVFGLMAAVTVVREPRRTAPFFDFRGLAGWRPHTGCPPWRRGSCRCRWAQSPRCSRGRSPTRTPVRGPLIVSATTMLVGLVGIMLLSPPCSGPR